MRKYSFVGLSLLAVSAITAAFAPSKAKEPNAKLAMDGIFGASTGTGGLDVTCRERLSSDPAANCSWTDTAALDAGVGSSTSGVAANSHSVTFEIPGPNGAFSASLSTAQGVE